MAKVPYTHLKLKMDTSTQTFEFNGQTIEVLQYLPIEDKYDLIMITLQKSLEDGVYNPLKLDVFFHLHLIYMYTNISFTDKQRKDELKLYDCLVSNGFLDSMLEVFDQYEYKQLFDMMEQVTKDRMTYNNSAAGVLQTLMRDLSFDAGNISSILENFNPAQFQEVINFAEAANGNRPIA